MKEFSLLVKPASADCNLRCPYCFYLERAGLYPETRVHRMTDAVLDRLVSSYLATEQSTYAFVWQGGEPTLMGVDFFRRVTDLQSRHGRPGSLVANALQTNGTLITKELARHFARFRFLLGVSLDGPAAVHDRFRQTADGRGSHAEVLRGIECLRSCGVEFNTLTLVTPANADRAGEVYRYLCENGFFHQQYIPCVEADQTGAPLPYAVSGEQWGDFLCALFDAWYRADVHRVSIRLFDSILTCLVEGKANVCHLDRNCCQYFVVEHDGDIYPCDFFVREDLRLGNISTITWEEACGSPAYLGFGSEKSRYGSICRECAYEALCFGDCLKHRLFVPGKPWNLSRLCAGWKRFFEHTLPGFRRLAGEIRRQRSARPGPAPSREPAASRPPAVGRNDPCPCGSGKKFKKCCLNRSGS